MKFLKKLRLIFEGELVEQSKFTEVSLENIRLNIELVKANKNLFETRQNRLPIGGVDETISEPSDEKEYASYAGRVSNFADEILFKKLKNKIGDVRQQLADPNQVVTNTFNMPREQYDWYLRGMESAYWSLHEWCVQMGAYKLRALQEKENNN